MSSHTQSQSIISQSQSQSQPDSDRGFTDSLTDFELYGEATVTVITTQIHSHASVTVGWLAGWLMACYL